VGRGRAEFTELIRKCSREREPSGPGHAFLPILMIKQACTSDQDFGGKSDRPAVELSSVAGGRLTMLASGVGEGGGGVGAQPECSGELRRGSACASVRASATFGGGRVGTDEA